MQALRCSLLCFWPRERYLEPMFTNEHGEVITPQSMRALGEEIGGSVDMLVAKYKLSRDLSCVVLASALLGEAQKQKWSLEQVLRFLTEVSRQQQG